MKGGKVLYIRVGSRCLHLYGFAVFASLVGQLCLGPAPSPGALSGSAGGAAGCLGSVAVCAGCVRSGLLSGAG